jgi:hypothetical protein
MAVVLPHRNLLKRDRHENALALVSFLRNRRARRNFVCGIGLDEPMFSRRRERAIKSVAGIAT